MSIATIFPNRPQTDGVDFYRPVYCVLGLPIDVVSLEAAQQRIYMAAANRRRCFLSTPNLNFAIACLTDKAFRNSIINSDLSTADGMPLVWVARLFGVPMRERVTGSGLFERLQERPDRVLSVYLFGGPDGAAAEAAARINTAASGLRCVGSHSPGYVSIDAMSSDSIIHAINDSRPDFLIVALGARKGQEWIERNLPRLQVPVVSHLGAVVNFAAGQVKRAPLWMQRSGLEWLWRVKEEPALWQRYLRDGMSLMRLLLTRVLPGAIYQRLAAMSGAARAESWISFCDQTDRRCLKPHGAWHEGNLLRIRRSFDKIARLQIDIEIDLSETRYVDSAFIGLLMLMYGHQARLGLGFSVHGASPSLRRIFKAHCAEFLLQKDRSRAPLKGELDPWLTKTAIGS